MELELEIEKQYEAMLYDIEVEKRELKKLNEHLLDIIEQDNFNLIAVLDELESEKKKNATMLEMLSKISTIIKEMESL